MAKVTGFYPGTNNYGQCAGIFIMQGSLAGAVVKKFGHKVYNKRKKSRAPGAGMAVDAIRAGWESNWDPDAQQNYGFAIAMLKTIDDFEWEYIDGGPEVFCEWKNPAEYTNGYSTEAKDLEYIVMYKTPGMEIWEHFWTSILNWLVWPNDQVKFLITVRALEENGEYTYSNNLECQLT